MQTGSAVKLVETADLMGSEKNEVYIALSHCWGTDPLLKTTKATLAWHKESIELTGLPPSFRDAITTVHELGYRYIWIDSLCIVQDCAEDWQRESVQMCNIYAQALFAMTSAHASSAFGGMFRKRDGSRIMPFQVTLKLPSGPLRLLYAPAGQSEIKWSLGGHPIYTRAWCIQEMILPSRNLVFELEGIRWNA